ncbi:unnamed protein product [Rotaria magnacalcarata]|nr:unnamed protein product [Rotaria magnacalcarata]
MNSKDQENRARKNCGKMYRKLLSGCDVILDDEKYFKLSGNNVGGNASFYSINPVTSLPNIKFQKRKKFEPKLMIWMAMFSKGFYDVYIHRDLASAHYSNLVKERLHEKNVPLVARQDNPPNVPQARSIETVWALLERKVYENNWEAENLDAFARRIKQKAKEFDQNMLQAMVEGVRKKLRAMWRDGLYSVF